MKLSITLEFTTYSFLAPALVNGDNSGLDEDGLKALEAVKTYLEVHNFSINEIVHCSDEGFFTSTPCVGELGGTCLEYTAMKLEEK